VRRRWWIQVRRNSARWSMKRSSTATASESTRRISTAFNCSPGVQSQLGNDLFLWFGSSRRGYREWWPGAARTIYTVNGGDGKRSVRKLARGGALRRTASKSFRVISNSFDAEIRGATRAAVVNVVTKSGTNDLHGSFLRILPQRRSERAPVSPL